MSDMLQLVVRLGTLNVRRYGYIKGVSVTNLDDKLKHLGHFTSSARPCNRRVQLPDNSTDTKRDRRAIKFYVAASLLSLVGLADAIYLAVQHITGESVRCTIVSGCSEVLSSPYATVRGIPLALLGAAAYFTAFSLATLAAFSYQLAGKLLTILVGVMFLTSLWLLYLQAFVIGHYCQFCLLSAGVTIALTVVVGFACCGRTR